MSGTSSGASRHHPVTVMLVFLLARRGGAVDITLVVAPAAGPPSLGEGHEAPCSASS